MLPLVFPGAAALGLTGTERFRLQLPEAPRAPQKRDPFCNSGAPLRVPLSILSSVPLRVLRRFRVEILAFFGGLIFLNLASVSGSGNSFVKGWGLGFRVFGSNLVASRSTTVRFLYKLPYTSGSRIATVEVSSSLLSG